MTRALLFVMALPATMGILATSCHTSAPPVDPAVTVYHELLDAGCISSQDDAALQAIAQERDAGDEPAWLICLYNGGTVAACAVPCGPDD